VVLVDRPGAPQSEVRVGHIGLPRKTPEFHAVAVMSAILGGLFNSRLQRLLREERGYTYGVHAGFEFRRAAGPFSVRTAVQSEVTRPAIADILRELERIREEPPTADEVREARDYLVGVFPLRFESSAQVVAAIAGLVAFDLPDDEYDRYRPAVAAIEAEDAFRVAQAHVRPAEASVVVVGDADRLEGELTAIAGERPLVVIREPLEVPDTPEDVVEAAEEAEEAAEQAEEAAGAAPRAEA
jgi:predicted Zn-dependent peptidase